MGKRLSVSGDIEETADVEIELGLGARDEESGETEPKRPKGYHRQFGRHRRRRPQPERPVNPFVIDFEDCHIWRSDNFLKAKDLILTSRKNEKKPLPDGMVTVGKDFAVDLDKIIGEGYFGSIYLGFKKQTGEKVAVKISRRESLLKIEYDCFKKLRNALEKKRQLRDQERCFAKVFALETQFWDLKSAMVMELLGKDLGKLFKEEDKNFSLKTTMMLGIKMLHCLEQVHAANILHCDLRPENFLTGRRSRNRSDKIYIVDFGLAKSYRRFGGGHIKESDRPHSVRGTVRYISINTHRRLATSRRDELESLGYVLLYFLHRARLPWQGLGLGKPHHKSHHERHENQRGTRNEVFAKLKEEQAFELCRDYPPCFRKLFLTAKRLSFEEEPNYHSLRANFYHDFKELGWDVDYQFDWMMRGE